MTTIVRYKNQITCDNIYIDVIGTEVVKNLGGPKLYKHPHFNAICGVSGSISAGMFELVNRHATNILANLNDYPEVDIDTTPLTLEYKETDLYKGSHSGFEFVAFTKRHTLFIHYGKESKTFSITVKPAEVLVVVGSGSAIATKSQWINQTNPDFTALDVAREASRLDTFSGNRIFVTDISELGEL